jgi:hypothetical protein
MTEQKKEKVFLIIETVHGFYLYKCTDEFVIDNRHTIHLKTQKKPLTPKENLTYFAITGEKPL